MTPEQIELARHALGLPNKQRVSYRNRFIAGPGHSDYDNWMQMTADGNARRQIKPKDFGGDDYFRLTLSGAVLALKPGESLDPVNFRRIRP